MRTSNRRRLWVGASVLAAFLIAAVALLWANRSSAQWGDVPTWVGAVATIAAAVGAFIAVRIAYSQLTEQRAELKRQGEEQKRQAAEQQRLAELQTKQLEQLEQQAQLTARQIARLDSQAEAFRRAQAEQVHFFGGSHMTGLGPRGGLVISNGSERPIRLVDARVAPVGLAVAATGVAGSLVRPEIKRLSPLTGDPQSSELDEDPDKPIALVRHQSRAYLVWAFDPAVFATLAVLVRFTDDANVRWQLDQEMRLTEVSDDEW